MVYPYNEVLFSNKMIWSIERWSSKDEPWKHDAKWKKPMTKDHTYCLFIWNMQNCRSIDTKDICNCLGMEWGGCWGKLGSDWTEFPFQWWNVLKLTVAMIGRACEYTKKQLSCILQLDELYLNNAIILKKIA